MNVTLIVVDGLQLAALGAYGNEWIPTPTFDALAAESVVFDQHFADVPCYDPFRARHAFPPLALPRQDKSPHGLHRIEMASLQLGNWTAPSRLLAEQFDDWELDDEPEPWSNLPTDWLDPNDDASLARLQRAYSAVVRNFDEELLTVLVNQSRDDTLILAGARGQNLGEHGIVGNVRPWLHEELVHLPLLIRLPAGEQAGRRVASLTQTVDIGATIRDACGLSPSEDAHGNSLLPLCRGAGPARSYACTGLRIGAAAEFALQTPEVKVMVPQVVGPEDAPRKPMFFIKPDDRWEVNDLRQSNLDYAEQLEQTLRAYVDASAKPGKLEVPPLPSRHH